MLCMYRWSLVNAACFVLVLLLFCFSDFYWHCSCSCFCYIVILIVLNIVTNIVVTNKGAGYSSGATSISIVYPGSGAIFETNLTELTYNEAATYEELGLPSNQFTNRKTTDIGGGGIFRGEND